MYEDAAWKKIKNRKRKIYSEDIYFHMRVCVIVVYIPRKRRKKKKILRDISLFSENLDIASRNQIRKYATGAAVTGNIQLRLCLRAYWPPLEFPRMPRIRPRLLLFAYTSPQSLERLHDVVSRACIIARNIPRRVSADRKLFRRVHVVARYRYFAGR